MWGPKCEKIRRPWVEALEFEFTFFVSFCFCFLFVCCCFQTKSRESGKSCNSVVVQKDMRVQNR